MTTINLEDIQVPEGVTTQDAKLTINMPKGKLSVGKHVFQLEVTDTSGNVSQPASLTVLIVDTQAPTAVLALTDLSGRPVTNNTLPFGQGFILDGSGTFDNVGSDSYKWVLVS